MLLPPSSENAAPATNLTAAEAASAGAREWSGFSTGMDSAAVAAAKAEESESEHEPLIVSLEVVEARGLSERDKSLKYWHLADPYAVVKLLEGGGRGAVGREVARFETAAARATLAPRWGERFCFCVAAARDGADGGRARPARVAYVELFDFDSASADDPMGRAEVPLPELALSGAPLDRWLALGAHAAAGEPAPSGSRVARRRRAPLTRARAREPRVRRARGRVRARRRRRAGRAHVGEGGESEGR